MKKLFGFIFAAVFVVFFVWLIFSAITRYKNGMDAVFRREAELQKHEILAEAMLNYAKKTGRFPSQLSDLVAGKFLPDVSNLYTSPYDENPSRVSRFEDSAYVVSGARDNAGKFYILARPSEKRDTKLQEGFFEINDFLDKGIREIRNGNEP